MNRYIIGGGPNAVGLGDYVCLTPMCRHLAEFGDVEVHLHPKAEPWLPLFKYIANAKVVSPATHIIGYGSGHTATRMLRAFQLDDRDPTPSIALCGHEIAQARDKLSKFRNPVALGINGSIRWKHRNELPSPEPWRQVIRNHKDRDFIQFGTSTNFTKLSEAKAHFIDLDIREVAAMFCVIGLFVGICTGLEHLMMAVGGRTVVALPNQFSRNDRELWMYAGNRSKYVEFEEVSKIVL